jgi:hypothetical protein
MSAAYERCGFMGERVLGFAYKVGAGGWHPAIRNPSSLTGAHRLDTFSCEERGLPGMTPPSNVYLHGQVLCSSWHGVTDI